MAGQRRDPADPSNHGGDGDRVVGPSSWDEALTRLEDVLLAFPYDRALPDLHTILAKAGVSEDFLRADERAAKVLHEAIVARPLSSWDTVSRLRTEVELLTLEVEVLTDRLRDANATEEEIARASARLGAVRRRLHDVQRQL